MIKHISVCFLFLLAGLPVFAQQQIGIKTLSLQSTTYNEVTCLAVKFNATLKYSLNNLLQQGDSSCDKYIVEVKLKTDNFINTTKGYGTYQNDKGLVKNTYVLLLSNDVREFDNLTIYIPMAALDIPEGESTLTPVFTVTDKRKREIAKDIAGEPFKITVPQKIKLHVMVKDITVAETDARGELWDYFFADTAAAKPEVCWSILLAQKKINGSPYTKDSYTYKDEEGKDAVEFTISKNDIFYLNTYDYDMMSFSDEIGSLRIDMNEMERFSGSNFTSRFGKVVKINFTITIL
ncbi:MAG: hypothetical protein KA149_07740 [Chitinophagales bacterium]|nr:hypothetical protein [Chitinophagales bacterium]